MLVVLGCQFHDDGDAVHRFHAPSRALSRLPEVTVVDVDLNHHRFLDVARAADVLVLAGVDSDLFPLVAWRRSQGRATVLEANDYFFDIQPWSPIASTWYDRAVQDAFVHSFTACDGVQASMPELARRWRERTDRPVAAFPNYLVEVAPLPPPPDRPLTIGWAGSPGHFADWYHVAPYLQRWLDAHPDVRLAVMTHELARPFVQLPSERYRFAPFGSLQDYLAFLRGVDIGLAPLLPSGYNRCRSDVKFLEYASCGVAGIYADLEPYRSVVDGGTGLLYRDPEDLLRQLDRMAGDTALRQGIRERAYEYVARERRLDDHIGERLAFYRSLTSSSDGRLPEDLLAHGDGRYVQLRPGAPEDALRQATAGAASAASVDALAALTDAHPRYLSAHYQLGRHLNDLRRTDEALAALEKARALAPGSSRTLAEAGRSHFLKGDTATARRVLEDALALNPRSQPAWQYLLRLLRQAGTEDAISLAQRIRDANPANYPLALLAARLLPANDRVAFTHRLVDETHLLPEEVPLAAPQLSQSIAEIPVEALSSSAGLALLRRACEAFPHSARLATVHAQALRRADDHPTALAELRRANTLHHAARAFLAEYPKDDGTHFFWQFGEHIQETQSPRQNPPPP